MGAGPVRDDAGESLVEVLVATAILGTTLVMIVGGFLALSKFSAEQKDQGRTLSTLAAASEYVKTNCRTSDCTAGEVRSALGLTAPGDPTIGLTGPAGDAASGLGRSFTVVVTTESTTFRNTVVFR